MTPRPPVPAVTDAYLPRPGESLEAFETRMGRVEIWDTARRVWWTIWSMVLGLGLGLALLIGYVYLQRVLGVPRR